MFGYTVYLYNGTLCESLQPFARGSAIQEPEESHKPVARENTIRDEMQEMPSEGLHGVHPCRG